MVVPMLYNFTAASARALEAARGWAARYESPVVQPEHVLYGLLDEDDGRAAELLQSAGLDLAALRRDLDSRFGPKLADGEKVPSLSHATEMVLNRAHELAVEGSADRMVA